MSQRRGVAAAAALLQLSLFLWVLGNTWGAGASAPPAVTPARHHARGAGRSDAPPGGSPTGPSGAASSPTATRAAATAAVRRLTQALNYPHHGPQAERTAASIGMATLPDLVRRAEADLLEAAAAARHGAASSEDDGPRHLAAALRAAVVTLPRFASAAKARSRNWAGQYALPPWAEEASHPQHVSAAGAAGPPRRVLAGAAGSASPLLPAWWRPGAPAGSADVPLVTYLAVEYVETQVPALRRLLLRCLELGAAPDVATPWTIDTAPVLLLVAYRLPLDVELQLALLHAGKTALSARFVVVAPPSVKQHAVTAAAAGGAAGTAPVQVAPASPALAEAELVGLSVLGVLVSDVLRAPTLARGQVAVEFLLLSRRLLAVIDEYFAAVKYLPQGSINTTAGARSLCEAFRHLSTTPLVRGRKCAFPADGNAGDAGGGRTAGGCETDVSWQGDPATVVYPNLAARSPAFVEFEHDWLPRLWGASVHQPGRAAADSSGDGRDGGHHGAGGVSSFSPFAAAGPRKMVAREATHAIGVDLGLAAVRGLLASGRLGSSVEVELAVRQRHNGDAGVWPRQGATGANALHVLAVRRAPAMLQAVLDAVGDPGGWSAALQDQYGIRARRDEVVLKALGAPVGRLRRTPLHLAAMREPARGATATPSCWTIMRDFVQRYYERHPEERAAGGGFLPDPAAARDAFGLLPEAYLPGAPALVGPDAWAGAAVGRKGGSSAAGARARARASTADGGWPRVPLEQARVLPAPLLAVLDAFYDDASGGLGAKAAPAAEPACRVPQLPATLPRANLALLLNAGRPFILRAAAAAGPHAGPAEPPTIPFHPGALQLREFVERYANASTEVSEIPYGARHASRFSDFGDDGAGVTSGRTTIGAYVSSFPRGPAAQAANATCRAGGVEAAPPMYMFSTQFAVDNADIRDVSEDAMTLLQSLGGVSTVDTMQFFLGPPGTGAPIHWHEAALNWLAFGEKRWLLAPPSSRVTAYSNEPILPWLSANADLLGDSEVSKCTQYPGDVFFVPKGWGHATLNTRASVGVAHNIKLEDEAIAHPCDVGGEAHTCNDAWRAAFPGSVPPPATGASASSLASLFSAYALADFNASYPGFFDAPRASLRHSVGGKATGGNDRGDKAARPPERGHRRQQRRRQRRRQSEKIARYKELLRQQE